MTWREWFYVISLIVLWGFLISGYIVREEKFSAKELLADMKKHWRYYIIGVWLPQMYIIFFALQMIFDFKEFKTTVVENYKKP